MIVALLPGVKEHGVIGLPRCIRVFLPADRRAHIVVNDINIVCMYIDQFNERVWSMCITHIYNILCPKANDNTIIVKLGKFYLLIIVYSQFYFRSKTLDCIR